MVLESVLTLFSVQNSQLELVLLHSRLDSQYFILTQLQLPLWNRQQLLFMHKVDVVMLDSLLGKVKKL